MFNRAVLVHKPPMYLFDGVLQRFFCYWFQGFSWSKLNSGDIKLTLHFWKRNELGIEYKTYKKMKWKTKIRLLWLLFWSKADE
jgi:hypothetical protein